MLRDWEGEAGNTHEDVVLYPDDVTASQIGGWKWRDVELLVPPVVRFARFDFAAIQRCQLPRFRLHNSIFGHVLNRLHPKSNELSSDSAETHTCVIYVSQRVEK